MEQRHSFNRCDDPPRLNRVTPVRRVTGADRFEVMIVSEKHEGFWQHWMNKRAEACIGGSKLCPWCLQKYPLNKWSGFLHCSTPYGEDHHFLELTRLAIEDLKKMIGDRPNFRGLIISVQRERKQNNSPFRIVVVGEVPAHRQIPKVRSVVPTLQRLWASGSPVQVQCDPVE
jgi:hypothetical protein